MRRIFAVLLVLSPAPALAMDGLVSDAVARMPMREYANLSMVIRADIQGPIKDGFGLSGSDFDACILTAGQHPDTWSWSFEKAARACITYARSKARK